MNMNLENMSMKTKYYLWIHNTMNDHDNIIKSDDINIMIENIRKIHDNSNILWQLRNDSPRSDRFLMNIGGLVSVIGILFGISYLIYWFPWLQIFFIGT